MGPRGKVIIVANGRQQSPEQIGKPRRLTLRCPGTPRCRSVILRSSKGILLLLNLYCVSR
jgi:hypothetical protein